MFQRIRKLLFAEADNKPLPASVPPGGDPVGPLPTPDASGNWKARGNAALARGDLQEARSAYAEGTREEPGNTIAWLNLAYAQLELAERDAAGTSLETAEACCRPDDPALLDIWRLQGRERQEAQDWSTARLHYEKVLARAPTDALVLRELATVHRMAGESHAAEQALVQALAAGGPTDLLLLDLTWLTFQQDRLQDALGWIRRCISLHPRLAGAHLMCAKIQHRMGLREDALASVRRAIEEGEGPEALALAGRLLAELGNDSESLVFYGQALRADPEHANALLGSVLPLMRQRRHEEALARLDHLSARGTAPPQLLQTKCLLLMDLARFEEALQLLEGPLLPTLAGNPDMDFARSICNLTLGRLERGWESFESRFRFTNFTGQQQIVALRPNPWHGEPLAQRTILLYPEQGFGDSIQMLRYLPMVAQTARHVWLEAQAPLHPLLRDLPSNCTLLAPGAAPPPTDFTCPLLSLPAAFRSSLQTIPAPVPYLRARDADIVRWRTRLGPREPGTLRVGIAWSGQQTHGNDHNRSAPLAMLRAFPWVGCQVISMQREVRAADEGVLASWPGLAHFGEALQDFGDTAALIAAVDVVVTVDTSVAHLAGALGQPVWVLLPQVPDWRWLLQRDDTPWYPTARLFRQDASRSWPPVLARVQQELTALGRPLRQ